MIDRIKKEIDLNRMDTSAYKDYIKSFTEVEKAKELFEENEDFKKLISDKKEVKKEEDEYF